MSSHCAPALHVALGCALPAMRHLEWFFDHLRIRAAAGARSAEAGSFTARIRTRIQTQGRRTMDLQRLVSLEARSRDRDVDARGLERALKARIEGEVRFDDGSRALYSTDGSNYRQVLRVRRFLKVAALAGAVAFAVSRI